MTHVRRKRLLFLGLIAVIFCVLAAMTPFGGADCYDHQIPDCRVVG